MSEMPSHTTSLLKEAPVSKERGNVSQLTILSPSHGGLEQSLAESCRELKIDVEVTQQYNGSETDRILMLGPMDHIASQIANIQQYQDRIPGVTLWFSEQIPNPHLSGVKQLSRIRAQLDKFTPLQNLPGNRFRRVGEILELAQIAPHFEIHTFCDSHAEFFRQYGIDTHITPWGYDESLGTRLNRRVTERPHDVIFIGNTLPPRGSEIVKIRGQLHERGISMEVYDGGRYGKPEIYHEERTKALNNAKLMLTLPMRPWDNSHFRFLLAGANGLVAVAPEPFKGTTGPFRPNEDFIMDKRDNIVEEITRTLALPEKMQQIADSLHDKVRKVSLTAQVAKVLHL